MDSSNNLVYDAMRPEEAAKEADPCAAQGRVCMCHVCECGMHKCPAKHTSSAVHYPQDLKSEYSKKYKVWPLQGRAAPTSEQSTAQQQSGPFVGETTHKVDYCPKKLPGRLPRLCSPPKTLDMCMGPPDGYCGNDHSEYKDRYQHKPLQPRLPARRPDNTPATGRFDDTTTHHSDFKSWPLRPRAPVKPLASALHSTTDAKLDDTTSYQVAYWDKSKAMQKPVRSRPPASSASKEPFYSETTHHADFGPKPIPKRAPPTRHDGDALANPGAAFSGDTTYHGDYKAWALRATSRAHPRASNNLAHPNTRFSADTSYHTDFKAPKLPKRCPALLRGRPQQILGDHFVY